MCYGTFKTPRPGGHPRANAYQALREAGHDPEVVRSYGWSILPEIFNRSSGRRQVKRLTGNLMVPTLQLDDGSVVDCSKSIRSWAQANPA